VTRPIYRRWQRVRFRDIPADNLDHSIEESGSIKESDCPSSITSEHSNRNTLSMQQAGDQQAGASGPADHQNRLILAHRAF
jgi:hypothetical protein